MSGIELATAYVTIAPSTKGVGASITKTFTKAGDEGGQKASSRFSKVFKRTTDQAGTDGGSRFASRFRRGSDKAAQQTESRFAKTAKKVAAAFAAAFVIKKGISFLTGTATAYKGVVGEAAKLKRFLGGTIEDASRLRFVAQQTGIDSDKFARGLGLFNKNLTSGKLDEFIGKTRDAKGQLLPMTTLLPRVADLFEKMPDGPEKTALAMKLFGRAGADLLPLLNKGSAGFEELSAKADELGVTLSEKDVDAMKEANKNSRLWKASMEAVRIQIGRYVLPVLTKFTGFLASKGPKAVAAMREGLRRFVSFIQPAVATVKSFFYTLTSGFTEDEGTPIEMWALRLRDVLLKVWGVGKRFFDTVSGFFKRDPKARFAAVATVVGGVLLSAVLALTTAVTALFSPIYLVIGAIALVAFGAIYAYKKFAGFRQVVNGVVRWLVGTAWPAVQRFGMATIDLFKRVAAWTKAHWSQIKAPVVATVSWFTTTALPAIVRFAGFVQQKWADLVAYTRRTWPAVKDAVSNVVHGIQAVVGAVARFVVALWSRWGDNLLRITKTLWSFITSTISNALQLIRGVIKLVTSIFRGDWAGAWEGIKQIAGALLKQIGNIVARGLGLIRQLFGMALDLLGLAWSRLWSGIKTVARGALRWLVDRLKGLGGSMKGALAGVKDVLVAPFKAGFKAIAWLWNHTIGKLKFEVPSWVPKVGGKGFAMPSISTAAFDKFHSGGIVPGPRGMEVPILARAGEIVSTIPQADRAVGSLDGRPIHLHGATERQLLNALRMWEAGEARAVMAG